MYFGNFQAVGDVHPLRVDFRATDHGDLSGETPQRIAQSDRAGVREGGRHHGTGGAKAWIARDDDIGSAGKRPAQRNESLAAHHDGLSHRHGLQALLIGFQPPRYRAARADHAVLGGRDDEDDFDSLPHKADVTQQAGILRRHQSRRHRSHCG